MQTVLEFSQHFTNFTLKRRKRRAPSFEQHAPTFTARAQKSCVSSGFSRCNFLPFAANFSIAAL